jgi:RecA-family ATPase
VDPFARAFSGEENSNSEVGRFLEALDVVKQRAGVKDLILTTHMGRAEFERGRSEREELPA